MAVTPRLHVDDHARRQIDHGLTRIRREFELADAFPADVLDEVDAVVDREASGRVDRRDVDLCTLDPAGSRDLDQAFAIDRRRGGYRLRYAIADVAAFVRPGGAIDAEAWRRGVTVYLPDARVPLHPIALSEGAASLLPGQDTPALLWSVDLDDDGVPTAVHLERALVRSRAQLSYADAQAQLDAGRADGGLLALRDVGRVLAAQERARGGVSLNLADQEVASTPDGYTLRFDRATSVEEDNARLSLLTGIAAATTMLDGGVGVLRTLPPAAPDQLAALRSTAARLGMAWPAGVGYGAWIATIDPAAPRGVAVLNQALRTFRGAGYEVFTSPPAAPPVHAALASAYAHVTAPLRRLVDRYAGQVALDLLQERPVAGWATAALDELPSAMSRATQRASAIDRAVVDLVESVILSGHEGAVYDAIPVGTRDGATVVHLVDPAIVATLPAGIDAELGTVLRVRLEATDTADGTVRFAPV